MTIRRADWEWRLRAGCALMACFCAGLLTDGLLRMKYVRSEPGVRDVASVRAAQARQHVGQRAERLAKSSDAIDL